jgi:hypothetical protein
MTWRSACVLAVVTASARADTIVVKLGSPNGLSGWTRSGSTAALERKNGELRSAGLTTWSHPGPLDAAQGRAIEARFAADLDAPSGGTTVIASDGRQTASFARRVGNTITLDGQDTTIVDDDLPHTYRLEVHGGHHRPLRDGNCPQPESDADHAKDALLASLDTKDASEARRDLDDAVSWVFDSGPVPRSPAPPVAAPPPPPDPRHPEPVQVSFSAGNVKPLLDQLRTLARRPRACR